MEKNFKTFFRAFLSGVKKKIGSVICSTGTKDLRDAFLIRLVFFKKGSKSNGLFKNLASTSAPI